MIWTREQDHRFLCVRNKTRITGSTGKGTWFPLCLYIIGTAGKCRCVMRGCEMSWQSGAYNRVLNCGSPQTQGGCVQSFVSLNRWTSFCIPWYNFVIIVPRARQQGANCRLCPYDSYRKVLTYNIHVYHCDGCTVIVIITYKYIYKAIDHYQLSCVFSLYERVIPSVFMPQLERISTTDTKSCRVSLTISVNAVLQNLPNTERYLKDVSTSLKW